MTDAALAIENIEVIYNHSIQALRGLSIEVPAGQIVALLGSNGAGKTTVLKAASGILPYETGRVASGRIRFLGEDIARREAYQLARAIGRSEAMQGIFATVLRVAPTRATVLLCGESGVGKDMIARAIHQNSPRRDKPFVKINCTAIPENLMESELFGYEKGAFTGANITKPGKFEQADTGTVFLDEIGDVPASVQVKLLRILQEREFERLGSNKVRQIDVRVIAATNVDLRAALEEGTFREDLYYRLNVMPIDVPALRDRKADIPYLADHFVRKLAELLENPMVMLLHA